MRVLLFLSAILAAASVDGRTVSVFLQPVTQQIPPSFLAEIDYDLSSPSEPAAQVTGYEAPEISSNDDLVRVGLYDRSSGEWTSSTTVLSAENFSKGYSPHFILTTGPDGKEVLGVGCRGVRIDAGQTRDFGPQVIVQVTGKGKQVELNKPVILSPEGKKVVQEEKTFLQKYWWVLAIGVFLAVSSGGGDQK
ncbi:hypothetical protein QBC46DRAFT_368949 [Diplogelasinospora grovesii]|uniref:Cyclin-dependent protein kinase regulator pho80 n=1 Tax=Diplogelasinospora grovesii TaxID=303347 RepID=A0AAN6NI05_9PEZI|nr:hypothetical protein QBC46DRAFT_368949 [Diplogelasinospora grovesii]